MTDTSPQIFEVSFIHEDRRVQARGPLTEAQQAAISALSDASWDERPQALSLMAVFEESQGGSAIELVDTIVDAMDDEEDEPWNRVRELAEQIDRLTESCANPQFMLVEFVWNNGGGDDNLFGQAFLADVAGPDNEALLEAFSEALEQAGNDAFYDFGMQTDSSDNYMSIDDLIQMGADEGEEYPELAALADALNTETTQEPDSGQAPRKAPRP